MNYQIRKSQRGYDPEPPGLLTYTLSSAATLADVLGLASHAHETVDVMDGDRYLVTYCGESPYWVEADGPMHQIGSHGWCHDCHKDGLGYMHHLNYETELAALTVEARDDRTLARMCEADGLTPEQYAVSVAGRAVALEGDCSFAIDVAHLATDVDASTATFAVTMWDQTCWRVTVPIGEGTENAAIELAEQTAHRAQPKRCYDCKGHTGHARDCGWARTRELLRKYPQVALPGDAEEYGLHDDKFEPSPHPTAATVPCAECGGGYWQEYAGTFETLRQLIPHADECSLPA